MPSEVRKLKYLEEENARLRRLVSIFLCNAGVCL